MTFSRKVALAAIVAVTTLAAGTAHASPVKCSRTIAKEFRKYIATTSKIQERCRSSAISHGMPALPYDCPDNSVAPKLQDAEEKMREKIARACGGPDGFCDGVDDESLALIHWNLPQCMGIDGTCRPIPIDSCASIVNCLFCIGDIAVAAGIPALPYNSFNPASFFPSSQSEPYATINKCQVAIGSAGVKFLQAKNKILNKCIDAKLKGKTGFADAQPCPDTDPSVPNKTVAAIQKQAQKKVDVICRACGAGGDTDKNSVCDTPPGLALSAIVDTAFTCPRVHVPPSALHPGGEDCGTIAVSDLQSYIDCIDCVLESETDCLAAAGSGDDTPALGINYPPACNATPSMPTPTPTPSSNRTPTRSPTPTLSKTPTPTITVTPGIDCGNSMIDPGETCDPPGSASCTGSGNGLEICSSLCTCQCPSRMDFEPSATDPATELDRGQTGISHDAAWVSSGKVTVAVTGCESGSRPCGTCALTGPIDNPAPDAGDIDNHRCRLNTTVKCTTNADCPGAGNACTYFFGAPLSLSAGGVTTCVVDEVIGIAGTTNIETGETASVVSLISRVYNGNALARPCPTCSDPGPMNDGIAGGTCSDGPRAGMPCDANGQSPLPSFGRTSLDCPPFPLAVIATQALTLKNSTDIETRTLSDDSPFCTAFGWAGKRCPCDTCSNAEATACASNADCGAGESCGGLRCLNDSATPGAPCNTEGPGNDPICGAVGGTCPAGTCVGGAHPGTACLVGNDDQCNATCGRVGEATRPSTCANGQCVSSGGDEGECQTAPTDNICKIESFRGCIANSDCPAAGDICSNKRRECYFDLDEIGATTRTVTATGVESVPMNDISMPTLASLFCIPATGAAALNNVAGLPGLGRLKLRGTARGLP